VHCSELEVIWVSRRRGRDGMSANLIKIKAAHSRAKHHGSRAKGVIHARGYNHRRSHGSRLRHFCRHFVLGGPAHARTDQIAPRPLAVASMPAHPRPPIRHCNAEQQVGRAERAVRHVFVPQLQNHHYACASAEAPEAEPVSWPCLAVTSPFGRCCFGELEIGRLEGRIPRRLLCERVDIGGDILRLPPRQRYVHPRMRIHD